MRSSNSHHLAFFIGPDFPKAKSADTESFIDARIVKQLENSGFYAKLYQ